MGKARRTRQGFMIRLDENDAALEQWLGQFARTQSMTKVVKLACYLMAGLEVPESLRAMLPHVEQTRYTARQDPAPPARRSEPPGEALAGVMQELAALRAALATQPPDRPPGPANPRADGWFEPDRRDSAGLTPSSGLDMQGRRRGASRSPSRVGPAPLPRPDAASAQVLIDSIRAFGDDFQRGR